jgi:hypothetical protein
MIPHRFIPLAMAALLAGCGPTAEPIPIVSAPPPPIRSEAGLDRVVGQDAER